MRENARGFKLLQEHQRATSSIYLFKVNGTKYLVSIHHSFLWLLLKKKNYAFDDEFAAVRFFEKVAHKLGHQTDAIGR
jgi:hypothetical protein